MQSIPFDEGEGEKMWYEMIFKMHVYIHTHKKRGWKNRKIWFMVTRASKATENIGSCAVGLPWQTSQGGNTV